MTESLEEAAQQLGQATVAGDMAAILRRVSPDGLACLMELSGRDWFQYFGYRVGETVADGDDRMIEIDYETDLDQPHVLRYRFRHVDGEWKAVFIERAG